MNKVVGNTVDVPRNAHRIDEAQNEHEPERRAREEVEHSEEIGAMKQGGGDWNDVPASISEEPEFVVSRSTAIPPGLALSVARTLAADGRVASIDGDSCPI